MTNRYIGASPSRPIDDTDHRTILALLPEYVAIQLLDQEPPPQWQPLEQHLKGCAVCRGEADALMELMAASYTDALPAAPAPPPPDLTFLDPLMRPRSMNGQRTNGVHPPVRTGNVRPLVVQFSAALLPRMRVHMAARAGNIHLRYAYEITPAADTDPTITVEVLVHDERPEIGLVRVCVELPDRSPFDQAGTQVTLRIDHVDWGAMTDQNGVAVFHDVPLDQMERWQIAIGAQESGAADR